MVVDDSLFADIFTFLSHNLVFSENHDYRHTFEDTHHRTFHLLYLVQIYWLVNMNTGHGSFLRLLIILASKARGCYT